MSDSIMDLLFLTFVFPLAGFVLLAFSLVQAPLSAAHARVVSTKETQERWFASTAAQARIHRQAQPIAPNAVQASLQNFRVEANVLIAVSALIPQSQASPFVTTVCRVFTRG